MNHHFLSTIKLDQSWKILLADEMSQPYFEGLANFLTEEKKNHRTFYPPEENIFYALNCTPFKDVKVVILGQDPYHGHGEAHGLCFSVPEGIKLPPSLKNIYKEIHTDTGHNMPTKNGNLEPWAKQGVLLLNATLTVRANEAGSHQNKGWESFTDHIISLLSAQRQDLVFLLWGKYAQNKEVLIDAKKHLILKAAHPSPFSAYRGFFGCKHFTQANQYLTQKGIEPINWTL